MPNGPIIGNFKGMAVIQIFKNKRINSYSSISKWVEIDHELLESMMFTNKITRYVEIEKDGNVINLYNESRECIRKYKFNYKYRIYLNTDFDDSVECLNLIECIDDSIEELPTNNIIDFTQFLNKFNDENNLRSQSRTSFASASTSTSTTGIDDDCLDGIFVFGDCVY